MPPDVAGDLHELEVGSSRSDKYTINRERVDSEPMLIADSTSDDTESSGQTLSQGNP